MILDRGAEIIFPRAHSSSAFAPSSPRRSESTSITSFCASSPIPTSCSIHSLYSPPRAGLGAPPVGPFDPPTVRQPPSFVGLPSSSSAQRRAPTATLRWYTAIGAFLFLQACWACTAHERDNPTRARARAARAGPLRRSARVFGTRHCAAPRSSSLSRSAASFARPVCRLPRCRLVARPSTFCRENDQRSGRTIPRNPRMRVHSSRRTGRSAARWLFGLPRFMARWRPRPEHGVPERRGRRLPTS